jgi:hypothetical protein
MSVDVEIYMNTIIKFFRENPNDLLNLIPKNREEDFYQKIREIAVANYNKGEEVNLTQSQLINACVDITQPKEKTIDRSDENLFIKTKFGVFCLN